MIDWQTWLWALGGIAALMTLVWVASVPKRDVSIIDAFWSLNFLLAAGIYAWRAPGGDELRRTIVLSLVAIWAIRLSVYLFWRNWGEPEDRRYRAMRERQGAGFAWISYFTVFLVQAVLAWLVSVPLLPALAEAAPFGAWDIAGCALWAFGMIWQVGGDLQLARFKGDPDNAGRVLSSGFWRYTRHPNYFGEFCIWWGYSCFAFATGVYWVGIGAAIMTVLLVEVSGVALLESDISERRPEYRDYVRRTSAFVPWFPARESRVETPET